MAGSADNGASQGGDFRPLSDFAIREWGLDFIYGGMLWAGIPEDVAQRHVASLRPTMERLTGSRLLWNLHWETGQNEDPLFQLSFQNIFGCEFWDHLRQLEALEPPTPSRRLRGKQAFLAGVSSRAPLVWGRPLPENGLPTLLRNLRFQRHPWARVLKRRRRSLRPCYSSRMTTTSGQTRVS